MQELTFEQVEDVSGGFQGLTAPWELNQFNDSKSYTDSTGGGAIRTVVTGSGGVAAGAMAGAAGAAGSLAIGIAVVPVIAGVGYDLATEGRDNNRVQNHPATKHLYGADGKLK